jgi:hypothetical protein
VKYLFRWLTRNSELLFWVTGIGILAITDPCNGHYTLCLFKLAGFGYCPGCGLGHSIAFLFRGDFIASVHAHPLGIPALFFILLRIYRLSFHKPVFTLNKLLYGSNVHVITKP